MLKSFTFLAILPIILVCGSFHSQSAVAGWWIAHYGYDRGCCYYYALPCSENEEAAVQAAGPQTRTAYYPPAETYGPSETIAAVPTYQGTAPASYAAPSWTAQRTSFLSPASDTSAGRLPWTPSNSGWGGRGR